MKMILLLSAETLVLFKRISSSCPLRDAAPASNIKPNPRDNLLALSAELASDSTVATTSLPSCLIVKVTFVPGLSSFIFFR